MLSAIFVSLAMLVAINCRKSDINKLIIQLYNLNFPNRNTTDDCNPCSMGRSSSHLDLRHENSGRQSIHSSRRRSIHSLYHSNSLLGYLEKLSRLSHEHERLVWYWLQLGCWWGRSNLWGSWLVKVIILLLKINF